MAAAIIRRLFVFFVFALLLKQTFSGSTGCPPPTCAAQSLPCDNGWDKNPHHPSACYYIPDREDRKVTWQEARAECQKRRPGADLAKLPDQMTNNFIHNILAAGRGFLESDSAWVGGSDDDREGEWKWLDGDTVDKCGFQYWSKGEPNNLWNKQHYLIMSYWTDSSRPGGWDDQENTNRRRYVCEYNICTAPMTQTCNPPTCAAQSTPCDAGWHQNPNHPSACYYVPSRSARKLEWREAKHECRALRAGADLAKIPDENTNKFLLDLLAEGKGFWDNNEAWVGATDKEKEGEWKWLDGSSVTSCGFQYWSRDQPDNFWKDQHFMLMAWNGDKTRPGGWDDQKNEQRLRYVCEYNKCK